MNKEKQIEEMAKAYYEAMLKASRTLGSMNEGAPKWYAKELYAKGYRKASDVAREIDDLKRHILLGEDIAIKCKRENGSQNEEYWKGKVAAFREIRAYIDAELKKKYTEDGK